MMPYSSHTSHSSLVIGVSTISFMVAIFCTYEKVLIEYYTSKDLSHF